MERAASTKYLYPPGISRDIHGLDMVDDDFPFVFFTEGVFDSVFCLNGVAIGGIQLSSHQRSIVEPSLVGKTQVWMFDNQREDKTSMMHSLEKARAGEAVFVWPPLKCRAKDANEWFVDPSYEGQLEDPEFLEANTFRGAKALLKLSFRM